MPFRFALYVHIENRKIHQPQKAAGSIDFNCKIVNLERKLRNLIKGKFSCIICAIVYECYPALVAVLYSYNVGRLVATRTF